MGSSNGYASIGHHPKSGYMTSDKYSLHNLSGMDLVIDIAGVYFPLHSITYEMHYAIERQHEVGRHNPAALICTEQYGTGSFTYASFLVKGDDVVTTNKALALPDLLQKAKDEGEPRYFDIYIIEVQGPRTPGRPGLSFEDQLEMVLKNRAIVGHIEALADCKITKRHRDIQAKQAVLSSWDFEIGYMVPAN